MLVANLVAGLDAAFKLLIDNHKSHVMNMNGQLSEPRFSQVGMVIKAKSCVICLHPNHTADQCYNKENQKKICGVDG